MMFRLSLGVFFGPLLGSGFELGTVAFVELRYFRNEGVVWVGVSEEGGDGEEDFGNRKCGRPLILEDVEADGAVGIDVWVIDFGDEVALGWAEGVISREMNV
jgi:hypothetical protein